MKREVMISRLAFKKEAYEKLQEAYIALIEGGVKAYTIDNRQLTRFDLAEIKKELEDLEDQIDALESAINGGGARKAFGVVPRDW